MWVPGAVPEPPQRPAPAIAEVLEEIRACSCGRPVCRFCQPLDPDWFVRLDELAPTYREDET